MLGGGASESSQLLPVAAARTSVQAASSGLGLGHDDGSHGGGVEHNQLGTINGAYVPVLLNVMGVILFLRLSWGVGQLGVLGMLAFFVIAETQAILTVLSLSAIVSNGNMRGGGPYYMISRNLGPELGGAVGTLFYSAYAVGATFYVIGLATAVKDTFFKDSTQPHLLLMLGTIGLFVILLVALGGAEFFTKINVLLFMVQFGSIAVGMVAMMMPGKKTLEHGGEYLGPSTTTLRANLKPDYTYDSGCGGMCNFATVMSLIWASASGLSEGANLSGDLKDPAKSIPLGTLGAVATSIIIYLTMVIQFGAAFPRKTLQENTNAFQDACFSQYIVVVGVIISTASSALGALFGGSRLLQAIAVDELFPIKFFSKGSRKGNEPRRAVLFTWFVAQCGLFIGDLDAVAPIITAFFCLSYAFINISCFLMAVSGTINFRPRFKYYSWHLSLFGGVLNVIVMFYLNYWYATASIGAMILILVYLMYKAPQTEWGDVRQAIIFHQVRKYLLQLDTRTTHGKLWRPSLLLYVDNLDGPLVSFCNSLKKGGVYILGTVVLGEYARHAAEVKEIKGAWLRFIDQTGIKAFPQICNAPSARLGYQSLLQMSGLGAMTPNTVVLPMYDESAREEGFAAGTIGGAGSAGRSLTAFYCRSMVALAHERWESSFLNTAVESEAEYVGMLHDILCEDKNMVVAQNFDLLDEAAVASKTMTIDVWMTQPHASEVWASFAQESLFMLQMAHILVAKKHTAIRVMRVVEPGTDVAAERARVAELVAESRIDIHSINIVVFDPTDVVQTSDAAAAARKRMVAEDALVSFDVLALLNAAMRAHSKGANDGGSTYLCFAPLPSLPSLSPDSEASEADIATAYLESMRVLTEGLPATALVATGGSESIMSRDI
ncbi:amino acid permease [Thecamonas trahens ATCC 50062]|uniref:Amino acid permease n=1 Tax=Thecamonas trahens ATCC 50062 TaxID=461836 RepID=A0A0L0DHP7_THETB|nr:amino acid permease [Thecamonas trahens ATCC 50062]KNC51837.1 amino acid permease [Thecamonas trahens ATCC 50062]|eukprot:XP_013755702.1 amino acid permease [Thecamonas trahens ATCC 50062]